MHLILPSQNTEHRTFGIPIFSINPRQLSKPISIICVKKNKNKNPQFYSPPQSHKSWHTVIYKNDTELLPQFTPTIYILI